MTYWFTQFSQHEPDNPIDTLYLTVCLRGSDSNFHMVNIMFLQVLSDLEGPKTASTIRDNSLGTIIIFKVFVQGCVYLNSQDII